MLLDRHDSRDVRLRPGSGGRRGIPERLRLRGRYVLGRLLDRRSSFAFAGRLRKIGNRADRYLGLARAIGFVVRCRNALIRRDRSCLVTGLIARSRFLRTRG